MRMKSGLLIVVGALIAVAGVVFALQGLSLIHISEPTRP